MRKPHDVDENQRVSWRVILMETRVFTLVGGLVAIFYFPIYWEWSSQLTNVFQRGSNHQPVYVFFCVGFITCLFPDTFIIIHIPSSLIWVRVHGLADHRGYRWFLEASIEVCPKIGTPPAKQPFLCRQQVLWYSHRWYLPSQTSGNLQRRTDSCTAASSWIFWVHPTISCFSTYIRWASILFGCWMFLIPTWIWVIGLKQPILRMMVGTCQSRPPAARRVSLLNFWPESHWKPVQGKQRK